MSNTPLRVAVINDPNRAWWNRHYGGSDVNKKKKTQTTSFLFALQSLILQSRHVVPRFIRAGGWIHESPTTALRVLHVSKGQMTQESRVSVASFSALIYHQMRYQNCGPLGHDYGCPPHPRSYRCLNVAEREGSVTALTRNAAYPMSVVSVQRTSVRRKSTRSPVCWWCSWPFPCQRWPATWCHSTARP